MKYTETEFVKEIRRLYPNNYDDLSDKDLLNLWFKKYPNDKLKVEFNETSPFEIISNNQERKESIVYHKSNWGIQVLKVGIVLVFLIFSYLKNPTKQDFLEKVSSEYYKKFYDGLQKKGLGSMLESFCKQKLQMHRKW